MATERVAELMTREVVTIHQDADVRELEQLLLARQVHGAPVVDDSGALVGVVSQSDLLAWHFSTGVSGAAFYDYANLLVGGDEELRPLEFGEARDTPVSELMSRDVHGIGPDAPIAVAAATLRRLRIHRLIVMDEASRVIGIVSALDLLRAIPGVEE
jgi:CBS domain-containing protein